MGCELLIGMHNSRLMHLDLGVFGLGGLTGVSVGFSVVYSSSGWVMIQIGVNGFMLNKEWRVVLVLTHPLNSN